MNFWRSFGFYTPSPIDNILERDAFELEELLAEDDISQELNSHNKNLIAYLSKPNVLENIVRYVTEPSYHADELDEAKRKKYGSLCADILALEAWTIADGVTQNEGLVEKLCAFLEAEPPLDPVLAAQGSRIIGSLLKQKPAEIIAYIQSRDNAVQHFLGHLKSGPVMELLLKLIRSDDAVVRAGSGTGTVQWLRDEKLIPQLVTLLHPDQPASVHENAANALCEIAAAAHDSSPLLSDLLSEETCLEIFTHAFANPSLESSALKYSLPLLSVLIEHAPTPSGDDAPLPPVLSMFQKHIAQIKALLESSKGSPTTFTFGELSPPFGFVRMKVMEICSAVVKSKYEPLIYRCFIEDKLLTTCMNLFFRYEFNNMLHRVVAEIVKTALASPDLALKTALFDECELHKMIAVNGMTKGEHGLRRGYMGFVTDLSAAIEKEAEELQAIKDILEASEEWKFYCANEFRATKKLLYPDAEESVQESHRFSTDEEQGEGADNEWESFSEGSRATAAAVSAESEATLPDALEGAEIEGSDGADASEGSEGGAAPMQEEEVAKAEEAVDSEKEKAAGAEDGAKEAGSSMEVEAEASEEAAKETTPMLPEAADE
eukprot:TRINITY_DN1394_c0_g1_i1.p1 TRINITY_DN1394_c0_g1~~TRINITY_DN1394_c0_g1_i1.p1  ORF type:complete len:604 (+),score=231.28 TRINITY_DN1394_c0_g1_i1:121-1932(+)